MLSRHGQAASSWYEIWYVFIMAFDPDLHICAAGTYFDFALTDVRTFTSFLQLRFEGCMPATYRNSCWSQRTRRRLHNHMWDTRSTISHTITGISHNSTARVLWFHEVPPCGQYDFNQPSLITHTPYVPATDTKTRSKSHPSYWYGLGCSKSSTDCNTHPRFTSFAVLPSQRICVWCSTSDNRCPTLTNDPVWEASKAYIRFSDFTSIADVPSSTNTYLNKPHLAENKKCAPASHICHPHNNVKCAWNTHDTNLISREKHVIEHDHA